MAKIRIDKQLIAKGMVQSEKEAQGHILARNILVNDKAIHKVGELIEEDALIRFRKPPKDFVSRGGEKLKGAHASFGFHISSRIALDIGQSTGGFTDYLLQNGAEFVFGLDVGHHQLSQHLRNHTRVFAIEGCNARHLTKKKFQNYVAKKPDAIAFVDKIDLVVMDVSFISILKILPALTEVITQDFELIALVKPQFESKRTEIEAGGLITNPMVQQDILKRVIQGMKELNYEILNQETSPILGGKGNTEFLVHARKLSTGS